ncbi:MAG: hypothetical protein P8P81_05215 [Bacteroidia bacterium]|nr:hypothetical protein [Bacteroidia bacterium]
MVGYKLNLLRKMLTKKFILILLLLSSLASWAQPRSFSRNPSVFIKEYSKFLSSQADKKGQVLLEKFTTKWDSGKFVEPEQRNIISVANLMLINDLDVPSFFLLTETMLYAKDSIDEPKYISWSKSLIPALNSGNQTFTTLIKASRNLFSDNTIYESQTKRWYSNSPDYRFIFEDNRVKISFKNINLTCQAQIDQINIYNTSGSYYLDTDEWEGKQGVITWERVGFGRDNIYAEIQSNYTLKFERAEVNIDTVTFTNKDFLAKTLMGNLIDRASSADNIDKEVLQKSQFPQFYSFDKNIELGSYLDNTVQFKGGFAMKGSETISTGSPETPSVIEIYYKNKKRVLAKSPYFTLKEGKINAMESEVTILTDSGTIYHPNLKFNLNLDNKILVLIRGKEGLKQAPFYDNDHQIDIFVDKIIWKLELPKIEFDVDGEEKKAFIESQSFYKEVRYEKIPRGILKYHPLSKMRNFVIQYRKREFTLNEYSNWMGSKPIYLKSQIIELADLGYLFFNPATDSVKIRKKLDHAVLSHKKLMDYDVIRFSSVISARSNAFLNLINNTFNIEGVRAFKFSDSQSVYAFPHEQTVILKNKRRMEFGGKLTAGKFDFYSDKFEFDYFNFDITSDNITEMVIFTKDLSGKPGLVAVKSVLRDINGTLEIDKSNNKSGLKNFPEYPRFTSNKGSVIAYDKPNIHGGVYDKDRFRFEVDPFTIENLDNFTTEGLSFPGTFVAGGIIPDFDFEAKIMDDYSLGFERTNPAGGYPMYDGKGQGNIDIRLSEEGFTAKGNIEYEGAVLESQDILMTPDFTSAQAESYVITENEKYPNLAAKDVNSKWVPNQDSMYIYTNDHEVTVLRDNQQFSGNLIQTNQQLAGIGSLVWDKASLKSLDMKFKPNEVNAQVSDVEINSMDQNKIAFSSKNLNSHIDFTSQLGDLKSNEIGILTELPFNQFSTSMDEYKWDMANNTIEFNKGPKLPQSRSYFVSSKYDQEGLRFESTNALFDINEGIIYAKEVPYIDVADSRIYPYENKVDIHEGANIQRLKKSRILASRTQKFHQLYDGDIKIEGRYALSGSASYEFKDKHDTHQVIKFNKIRVKGRGDTSILAKGSISDSSAFFLSPKIAYKGKTELYSNQKDIFFSGYVKPQHSFTYYPSRWFRYSGQPKPENVIIPATNILNEDRRKMYASVSIANDSTHIYPTLFNFKRSYADLELTSDTGIFYYDESKKTFFVGDSMKLLEGSPRGSYLAFNEGTGEVFSEGKIEFNLDKDPNFNARLAGNISKLPNDSVFTIQSLMALNLVLPEDCYQRMVEVINENDNDPADNNNQFVEKALSEFLNDNQLKKSLNYTSSSGEIKPPSNFSSNFLFTKASLYYDAYKRQFIGLEPIHIASINGKQVNKALKARMAITKRRSSIKFTLYLEASKYDWFYIDYYMGALTVASTDKTFNDIIKTQGVKMSKGKFRIRPASPRSVGLFLTKMEN